MSASETALQILSGTFAPQFHTNLRSNFSSICCIKSRKDRHDGNYIENCVTRNLDGLFKGEKKKSRSESLRCKCSQPENNREAFLEDGSGRLVNGLANEFNFQNVELGQPLKNENGTLLSNDGLTAPTSNIFGANSIEDEAWTLLRASMVYYCGNPVGTIAANDSSNSNTLNYDQVFIRDFIPSGIAFLLKGDYEIVRNFILHTLQLQVFIHICISCVVC